MLKVLFLNTSSSSYFLLFNFRSDFSMSCLRLAHLSLFPCCFIKQPNFRGDVPLPVPVHLPSGPSPPFKTHTHTHTPLPHCLQLYHSALLKPEDHKGSFLCSCPLVVTFPFNFLSMSCRTCQSCICQKICQRVIVAQSVATPS